MSGSAGVAGISKVILAITKVELHWWLMFAIGLLAAFWLLYVVDFCCMMSLTY